MKVARAAVCFMKTTGDESAHQMFNRHFGLVFEENSDKEIE